MKASKQARFSLDKKYKRIANLLMVFVWYFADPSKACTYALTYRQAYDLLEKRGHTNTDSWKIKGVFSVPNPGPDWLKDLEPHRMTPDRWRDRIIVSVGIGVLRLRVSFAFRSSHFAQEDSGTPKRA